jgi:hypothetical protein
LCRSETCTVIKITTSAFPMSDFGSELGADLDVCHPGRMLGGLACVELSHPLTILGADDLCRLLLRKV